MCVHLTLHSIRGSRTCTHSTALAILGNKLISMFDFRAICIVVHREKGQIASSELKQAAELNFEMFNNCSGASLLCCWGRIRCFKFSCSLVRSSTLLLIWPKSSGTRVQILFNEHSLWLRWKYFSHLSSCILDIHMWCWFLFFRVDSSLWRVEEKSSEFRDMSSTADDLNKNCSPQHDRNANLFHSNKLI